MADMKLAVIGAAGRMGRDLVRVITAMDGCVVAGAVEPKGSAAIGQDAGMLAGVGNLGVSVTDDALEVIARVDGVSDRNAAEALKGFELYVDRTALPAAEEDEYYHTDLIGLTVCDADGRDLGTVVAIQNFGAGDLLEYRLKDNKRTELLPFNMDFVPLVDIPAGRVTIAPPPDDEPAAPEGA